MAEDLEAARRVVVGEYQRLCQALALQTVDVDVYQVADSPEYAAPSLRESGANPLSIDAGYSASRKVVVVPLCSGDISPLKDLPFPPKTWTKWSDEWPAWRIDLWHEVVHQYSDVMLGSWDTKEARRRRADGSLSTVGHGAGWYAAIKSVAAHFDVSPDSFDSLLDS